MLMTQSASNQNEMILKNTALRSQINSLNTFRTDCVMTYQARRKQLQIGGGGGH